MYFWKFFDLKSYIIMAIMMTGGILLRKFSLIPIIVLGPLYTGIGFALFACGVRFIYVFFKKDALNS